MSKRVGLVYVGLSFLCIFFMLFPKGRMMILIRSVGDGISYPFRLVSGKVRMNLGLVKKRFLSDGSVCEIREKTLGMEVRDYQQQIVNLNTVQEENRRLRDLLYLRRSLNYRSIVAEIVSSDFIYSHAYITINKGKRDGINIDFPVVTFVDGVKSVVGRISEVGLLTSRVRTLKSELSNIGVYLPRIDVHSVVEGMGGSSKEIQLLYLDKDIQIQKGDKVYTSTTSVLFPPNFLIGHIKSIDDTRKNFTTHTAYVSPAVNFNKLSEVLVLVPRR